MALGGTHMSTTTASPTDFPIPPPTSTGNNGGAGMTRGANYFFGFLITFVALLLIFVGCGIGSRRRLAARRRRGLTGEWDTDPFALGNGAGPTTGGAMMNQERPVFYETKFENVGTGNGDGDLKWANIEPLAVSLIKNKQIDAPQAVFPYHPDPPIHHPQPPPVLPPPPIFYPLPSSSFAPISSQPRHMSDGDRNGHVMTDINSPETAPPPIVPLSLQGGTQRHSSPTDEHTVTTQTRTIQTNSDWVPSSPLQNQVIHQGPYPADNGSQIQQQHRLWGFIPPLPSLPIASWFPHQHQETANNNDMSSSKLSRELQKPPEAQKGDVLGVQVVVMISMPDPLKRGVQGVTGTAPIGGIPEYQIGVVTLGGDFVDGSGDLSVGHGFSGDLPTLR